MRKYQLIISLVISLALVGGAVLIWKVRTIGFSARRSPMAIEVWLAHHARDLATPRAIKNLKNPIKVSPLILAEARDHFADHCATCHGNNGDGKTMLGEGMFPPPPNLSNALTQDLTDGEIFNIIKF